MNATVATQSPDLQPSPIELEVQRIRGLIQRGQHGDAQAAAEAKTEGQKLMEQARQATADWRAKQQEALKTEEHNLSQAISLRTQQEVFAIARKTLADLATTSLEVQLADIFIRRLKAMEPQAKAGLAASLKSAREPAVIRGAFDLPPEQKALIQKALNETFSADIHIRYGENRIKNAVRSDDEDCQTRLRALRAGGSQKRFVSSGLE